MSLFRLPIIFLLCVLCACAQKPSAKKSQKTIRIACTEDPGTLDPRKVRSLSASNIVHLLFEGLVRVDEKGQAQLGVAKHIAIDPDKTTYTFFLKDSFWSDGTLVTAYDFAYSWKAQLNRGFGAPSIAQFFVIKNAKKAYEGTASLDDVCIEVLDAKTLRVSLEAPTPFFLQIVACPAFFPIQHIFMQNAYKENKNASCISNGPFMLDAWHLHQEIVLKKNPHYRGKNPFETIHIDMADNQTALLLFEKGSLDWIGAPFSTLPLDILDPVRKDSRFASTEAAGTHFIQINMKRSGPCNKKLRQALFFAINRQEIVDHVMQAGERPAVHIVPSVMYTENTGLSGYDPKRAKELFTEAIKELGLKSFPPIQLAFSSKSSSYKVGQILREQWQRVLGIRIALCPLEQRTFNEKLNAKNYDMLITKKVADIYDPSSFFSLLSKEDREKECWQAKKYTKLVRAFSREKNALIRKKILHQIDALLSEEIPLIPLCHFSFSYMRQPFLEKVTVSPLGILQLQNAFCER